MALVILLLIFCLLLYPDGHLPSRRWRPLAWAGILAIPASVMPVAIEGWPLRGPKLLYENEPPPTMPHAFRTAVSVEEMVLFLTFLGAFIAAASLVVRMRRATGDEREQIRWFAYGGFVLAVAISANVFFLNEGGALAPLIGFAAIRVAATIALLKYRLYDIDVVITKTVVYGPMAS